MGHMPQPRWHACCCLSRGKGDTVPVFMNLIFKNVGWLGMKAHGYNLVRVPGCTKHIAKTLSQTLKQINANGCLNLLPLSPFSSSILNRVLKSPYNRGCLILLPLLPRSHNYRHVPHADLKFLVHSLKMSLDFRKRHLFHNLGWRPWCYLCV